MEATKTKDKKTCFVITPIGDNNSDIRRHIEGIIDQAIVPALGEKYEIEVAHRKYEIGSINDRVIKSVVEADLVIANLTTTNPNVMYELAIRHSFGKPVIVIAEEGTKLPFDIVVENTIFYLNDPTGASDLKQKLIEYEKPIDLEKKEYGPVYNVINKIPLYNEVESGKDVSKDKLLQYVIDRLDSLEKNMNLSVQKMSNSVVKNTNKVSILVLFEKSIPFKKDEINKILDFFALYDPFAQKVDQVNNSFSVVCGIREKDMIEFEIELKQIVHNLNKNISYNIMYKSQTQIYYNNYALQNG